MAKVGAAMYAYVFNRIFQLTDDYACYCMGVKHCEMVISSGDDSRISSKLNSKISYILSASATRVSVELDSDFMRQFAPEHSLNFQQILCTCYIHSTPANLADILFRHTKYVVSAQYMNRHFVYFVC
jgi:hypothetical protein